MCSTIHKMASYRVTSEHVHVFKCDLVIRDILTNFLRTVLAREIDEKDILRTVQTHGALLRLNKKQMQLIRTCEYSNFDAAILYQLIRNVTNIDVPQKGWGNTSTLTDHFTIGDIVENIKNIRNETFAHFAKATMEESTFQKTWKVFTDICNAIDTLCPGGNYNEQLEGVLGADFHPDKADEYEESRRSETDWELFEQLNGLFQSHQSERIDGIEARVSETEKILSLNDSIESSVIHEEDKANLKEILKKAYLENITISPSSRVQNYALHIDDVFIPLRLKEDVDVKHHRPLSLNESNNFRSEILTSYDDILSGSNNDIQKIFIFGEAGSGKSCYSLKLANLWAKCNFLGFDEIAETAPENEFKQIDFVFRIEMDLVSGDEETIEDIVCHCYFLSEHDKIVKVTARKILRNAKIRCLVILDSLDKWRKSVLPSTVNLKNCQIVFTSRPSKIAEMNLKYETRDKIFKLQCFISDDIDKVVPKLLKSFHKLDDQSMEFKTNCTEIVNHLTSPSLKHLTEIPFLATHLALHLYDNVNISKSVTDLYFEVIDALIKRAKYQNRVHAIESGLKEHTYRKRTYKLQSISNKNLHAFMEIGSYAFDDILTDRKIQFHRNQRRSAPLDEQVALFGLETGVLRLPITPTITKSRRKFFFLHRSILELFAALFLVYHPKNFEMLLNGLTHIDGMLNLTDLFTFMAEIDPDDPSPALHHLMTLSRSFIQESENYFLFHHNNRQRMKSIYILFCNLLSGPSRNETTVQTPTLHNTDRIYVFVDEDSGERIRGITSRLLQMHRENISSLFISNIPEEDSFLNKSTINDFLVHPLRQTEPNPLQHLYLEGRHLEYFNISNLTSLILKRITLEDNSMTSLSDFIKKNQNLKILGLIHILNRGKIGFLNLCFHELALLESLTLEYIALTISSLLHIQDVVNSSRSLKVLELIEINATGIALDLELQNKTSLKELSLIGVNLDPDTFQFHRAFLANNINLSFLRLEGITNENINLVLSCKKSLIFLDIANMTFTKQSYDNLSLLIQESPRLETLMLKNVRCGTVPLELDLSRKEHLETLYLSRMNIENIRLFNNMHALEIVVLKNLTMTEQDWDIFLDDLVKMESDHGIKIDLTDVNLDENHVSHIIKSGNFIMTSSPDEYISDRRIAFFTIVVDTFTTRL